MLTGDRMARPRPRRRGGGRGALGASRVLSPSAQVTAAPAGVVDRDRDETAAILYASATTGRPKGAQLTVGNPLSAGEIGAERSRASTADRTGTGLPLFHVFGQTSVMMATLTVGGTRAAVRLQDPAHRPVRRRAAQGPDGKILKRSIDRTALTRDPAPADVAARRH